MIVIIAETRKEFIYEDMFTLYDFVIFEWLRVQLDGCTHLFYTNNEKNIC